MSTATAPLTEAPLPKPEGLEGVVAASTALSHVYGEEGRLVYRGYDIHELAGKASFEAFWLGQRCFSEGCGRGAHRSGSCLSASIDRRLSSS